MTSRDLLALAGNRCLDIWAWCVVRFLFWYFRTWTPRIHRICEWHSKQLMDLEDRRCAAIAALDAAERETQT